MSAPFIFKKMRIKAMVMYHFLSVWLAIVNKGNKRWWGCIKSEHLYTAN